MYSLLPILPHQSDEGCTNFETCNSKGPSIMVGRSDVVKDADRVSRVLPAESTNKGLPANACTLPTSYVPP